MGYTGKPSPACERCRERRIRCDFGRPKCQKCKNARVDCPGYRDPQDLLFRNVTEHVIKRHHATVKAPSLPRKDTSKPSVSPPHVPRAIHGQRGVLAVSMTFLFECYLRGSSFEWVQSLYSRVEPDSLFARVVEATALAAYSHECHRTRLLSQSRNAYDITLKQLREVIASPGTICDATLASILLMSRFETLLADGTNATVTDSWTGHVAGAFGIVESRTDDENFADALSLQLAEHTLHNYNMWCMRARQSRPESHTRIANTLVQRLNDNSPNASLRRLRLRQHRLTAGFVKNYHLLTSVDISLVRVAIAHAISLDEEAKAFCDLLSVEAGYEVRPIQELREQEPALEIEPHSTQYHSYHSHYAARMWNNVRMLVVTVSYQLMEMVVRLQKQQTAEHDKDIKCELETVFSRCVEVIAAMCDQICDSAPQFLRPGSEHCTHASASYISWPLYVAARFLQGDRNRFAKDALRLIGNEFNIKSAIVAVENLHDPNHYDDWLLACYMF